ncbi:hypothetical protein TTHERM_000277389 (macronuclear) [Tetrahymena thermophila SB210]|uniref:Uncharacterized protein n=1 Tax=Tetrahymena thermophila (strain SB210) TaxID=312017 RepID=W7XJ46_TETTS|nr:hypothetical protein TTHERM_000277389 [Tetrahymena thermophila SB210]EWS73844.1 hypothetical protein TTHERM_000277389 [Tetrahymena thermophila SB210]|eukprot:XP_012653591.1 hypothetical protein TTHERM_000277389 [Tetrahymena thermophila SB210]
MCKAKVVNQLVYQFKSKLKKLNKIIYLIKLSHIQNIKNIVISESWNSTQFFFFILLKYKNETIKFSILLKLNLKQRSLEKDKYKFNVYDLSIYLQFVRIIQEVVQEIKKNFSHRSMRSKENENLLQFIFIYKGNRIQYIQIKQQGKRITIKQTNKQKTINKQIIQLINQLYVYMHAVLSQQIEGINKLVNEQQINNTELKHYEYFIKSQSRFTILTISNQISLNANKKSQGRIINIQIEKEVNQIKKRRRQRNKKKQKINITNKYQKLPF